MVPFKVKHCFLFLIYLLLINKFIAAQQFNNETLKVAEVYKETRFSKPNSIQFELLGQGFVYSINYERILLNGTLLKTAVDAGIAFYPPVTDMTNFVIPLSLNEILTFGNHHLELGIGTAIQFDVYNPSESGVNYRDFDCYYNGRLGYRFQNPKGKYLFRIGYTPFLYTSPDLVEYTHWGGISFGYNF